MLYTDLINMEVRVRRNDCASRIVNSFTRQVPSKATLLSFQSLYKSSGSLFRLIKMDGNAWKALTPQYISDFLVQYKAPRALRSSDKKPLQVPHFKLKTYGGRSFSYIAPYLLFNTQCHCSLSALNHWLQSLKMQNNCLSKTGAVFFVSREIIRGNIIKRAK